MTSSSGEEWVAPTAGRSEASWVGEQGLSMRFLLTGLLFAIVAVSHALFDRPLTAVATAVPAPLCLWLWHRRKYRARDEDADLRRGMIVWTAVATYGLWVSVLSTGGTTSPFFVFAIPLIFIAGVHTGPLVAFAVTGGVLACWLFAFGVTRVIDNPRTDLFGVSSALEGRLAVLGGAAIALFVGIQNFLLLETAKRRARRRAERSERLVEELRRAHAAERVAAARKSHFYAVMSHELRTPLGGLIGLIQALEAMPLAAREREIVANMKASGESLHLIINDVLDLEALERGAIRLEKGEVAIRRKLTEIVQLFAPLAERKQLVLQSDVAADVPPVLAGDPLRVRQILTNLVSNAIKFTSTGSVSLGARWDTTTRALVVTVADTGTGIASDRLESVFLPFEQNDPTIARRYGGTGLGLAIVKQLVEAMGGTIRVESEVGQGTRFVLAIPMEPLAVPTVKEPAANERPAFPHVSALVVDDDPINRYTSQLLLAQFGVGVATAASGVDALAHLRGAHCDLVFLDLDMPGMSGFELARAIRSELAVCPRLVALTAATAEEDRRAAREAGIDEFLAKPLDTRALLRLLGAVAATRGASEGTPPPPSRSSPFDLERVALVREATKHPDVHAALMAQFAASLRSQLAELVTACASHDRKTVEHLTHKLAGASANLGARRVETEARQLNTSARAPDFSPNESSLAPLADAIADTLSALEGDGAGQTTKKKGGGGRPPRASWLLALAPRPLSALRDPDPTAIDE